MLAAVFFYWEVPFNSFCKLAIFSFRLLLIFEGKSFTFLRSNERIANETPTKINANAVAVTNEIPENIGFANSMNEKIIPNVLAMARFPHRNIPIPFISNAIPNNWNERNITVKPTTNGKIVIEIPGYITR